MSAHTLSRRDFLRWAGLAGGTVIVAACASKASPAESTAAPMAVPATPDSAATAAVVNAQATEDAIAAQAKADAEAKALFEMTQDQLLTKAKEDEGAARAAGKTVIEMLSACGTVIEDKTQPHYWIIKSFMEKNPNILVKYTPSSSYSGAFDEVIMMRLASGDPPDCIYHYSSPIPYAARGTCLAVDDLMDADPVANRQAFFEPALAQLQWNGKTWGLPLNGSPDAMWYNTDMLQEKGLPTERDKLPKTLDELRDWSARFTQWDGDNLVLAGATPWTQSWAWFGKFVAAGGLVWDGARYWIDDPKNADLLNYWLRWIDEEYKGRIDAISASQGFTGAYPGSKFGMKLQAMVDEGLWALTHTPPEVEYEVARMPTGLAGRKAATSNWPNLMFVPAGAKHPKEGWMLTAYFATEGQYEWWDRWADVPVWKAFPEDRAPKDLVARAGHEKAIELTRFARSCLPDVVVQWNSPVDDYATDELSRAIDQVLHKATAPEQALKTAQEMVTARLQEATAR